MGCVRPDPVSQVNLLVAGAHLFRKAQESVEIKFALNFHFQIPHLDSLRRRVVDEAYHQARSERVQNCLDGIRRTVVTQ